jgi:spore maturation protein CgeB
MKFVIFGLTVSFSWGNGHAMLWRGLISALVEQGHQVVFFERDQPLHAAHRDLVQLPPGAELVLYPSWEDVLPRALGELTDADVGMVTSCCPDGVAASRWVIDAPVSVRCFYDMDTPITLERAQRGEPVEYIPPEGLHGFDLVLSQTGGQALRLLRTVLGARRVAPLYGCVDPGVHYPVPPKGPYMGDLSYLGTYAADRQEALELLLLEPARRQPQRRFVISGAQYPLDFACTATNLFFVQHLPPEEHSAFYCSSRLTLNVTRGPLVDLGYCPSGRLFEAAACGTPVLTDDWMGLDTFFRVDEEILVARTTEDVLAALARSPVELARIGRAARERALTEHTATHRAEELVALMEGALNSSPPQPEPGNPPTLSSEPNTLRT